MCLSGMGIQNGPMSLKAELISRTFIVFGYFSRELLSLMKREVDVCHITIANVLLQVKFTHACIFKD